MAGIGATLSFPRIPAKVPSPFDLPTFARCIADRKPCLGGRLLGGGGLLHAI